MFYKKVLIAFWFLYIRWPWYNILAMFIISIHQCIYGSNELKEFNILVSGWDVLKRKNLKARDIQEHRNKKLKQCPRPENIRPPLQRCHDFFFFFLHEKPICSSQKTVSVCFYSNNTVFPKQQSLASLSITHTHGPLQHCGTLGQTRTRGVDMHARTAHARCYH